MMRVVYGTRSHTLLQALLLALSACAIAGCGESLPSRPNVGLVVLDSLRADALSFAGYERKTSPTVSPSRLFCPDLT